MSNGDKITTQCPNCNSKLAVAALHAGKRLKCPKCQAIVDVPQPAVKADDDLLVRPVVQPPPLDSSATSPTNSQVPPLPQLQRSASKGFSRDFKAVISVIVLSIIAAGCLWFYEQWQSKESQRRLRQLEARERDADFTRKRRNMERDWFHRDQLEAIEAGDWRSYEKIEEERKTKEREWKEEDFRKELLEATRGE